MSHLAPGPAEGGIRPLSNARPVAGGLAWRGHRRGREGGRMVQRWTASRASEREFRLAEGPIWDAPRGLVHWVEIEAGAVHTGRLGDRGVELLETREVDRTVGAIALGRGGELLVAGLESLFVLAADGELTPGPRILPPG